MQGIPPTTTKNSTETETTSFHRLKTASFKCENFLGLPCVETPEENTLRDQDQSRPRGGVHGLEDH